MKAHFEGSELLPFTQQIIWDFITNPEKIGPCIPDVVTTTVINPSTIRSEVKVGVGPVKGTFTFTTSLHPDGNTHSITITINGEGLGTMVEQIAKAQLTTDGERSQLQWFADATITGKLVTFGGKMLEKQAAKIIQNFFTNIRAAIIQSQSKTFHQNH